MVRSFELRAGTPSSRGRATGAGAPRVCRQGAEALAPITTLLTSLEPDRVTVSASNEYLAKVASLHERWETEVRGPLAAFALSHPSRGVQEMAVELDTHVEWVLVRGASLIREVLEHRNHQEMRKLVWDHYRQAQGLIADLHAAIAQDESTALRPPPPRRFLRGEGRQTWRPASE